MFTEGIPPQYQHQISLFLQQPDGEEIARRYLNVTGVRYYWTHPEVKEVKSVKKSKDSRKNKLLIERKLLAIIFALCQKPELTVIEIAYKTGLSKWEVKKYLSMLKKYANN